MSEETQGLMRLVLKDEEGRKVFSCGVARTDAEAAAKDADASLETLKRGWGKLNYKLSGDEDERQVLSLVGDLLWSMTPRLRLRKFVVTMTEDQAEALMSEMQGICAECGDEYPRDVAEALEMSQSSDIMGVRELKGEVK